MSESTKQMWRLPFFLIAALFLLGTTESPGQDYLRGNANGDAEIDLSDAICALDYLFNSTGSACSSPGCLDALDSNDDGETDISDPVSLLAFLFQGGTEPPAPGTTSCGPDPTADLLSCESSSCEPSVDPCPLLTVGSTGEQRNADVAMGGDGDVFVVWEADQNDNEIFEIRGAAYNPEGTERIDPFTVNGTSSGQQLMPAVAMDGSGRFVVVWEDDSNQNGLFQVRARGFDSNAIERIEQFTVNVHSVGQQVLPDIAMDSNGNFIVVWAHDGNLDENFEIEGRGFRADGTQSIAEFTVNDSSSGQQSDPAVAMDSSGNFVVVWADAKDSDGSFDVHARGFDVGGTEHIAQFTVNAHSTGQQADPAIAMDSNGNFVVVWEHDGNSNGLFNIHARGFDATGTERIPQFEVNTSSAGQQVDPTVAMNSIGNFVVAWEHDGDNDGEFHVRFRGFNADGTESFVQTKADCIEPAQHLDPSIGIDGSDCIRIFWGETPDFLGPSRIVGRMFSENEPTDP